MFSLLEHAYSCLCQFACANALAYLRLLPPAQRLTGWVQHQTGRAHLEMLAYRRAEHAFATMRQVDPYRFQVRLLVTCVSGAERQTKRQRNNIDGRTRGLAGRVPFCACVCLCGGRGGGRGRLRFERGGA